MRGFFIVYDDINNNTGVNKKIRTQIEVFNKHGVSINPKQMFFKSDLPGYKLWYRIPFTNISPVWKYDKSFDGVDFLYLRRPYFANVWFLSFLKRIKKQNPKVKIIYEIPTYPYDDEIIKKKSNLPIYIKDRLARKKLHRYVDRVAILSGENRVFGIDTLPITNGYDYSRLSIRTVRVPDSEINIMALALFDFWHGYERLLHGLSNYYSQGGTRKITIHFAGDGPELSNYKELSKQLGILDKCVFYGMLDQEQLSRVYNECDIAATSFGLYKKHLDLSKELKSREYLAKGLPIICSGHLDLLDIEELRPYLLKFPNNDSVVDFEDIITFYDSLYKDKSIDEIRSMSLIIRGIAEKHLNMDKALGSVIEYLNE